MKNKRISILSTRPLHEALIKEASQHQIALDCISFITTQSITGNAVTQKIKDAAAKNATVVFTSMNGAEAVIDTLRQNALRPAWRVYCMGAATQSLVKDYFAATAITGTGRDALELVQSIINDSVKEIIFFCGNQRRDELPLQLQKNKIEVQEIVVYETNEVPVKINKEYNGILFFSPNAVKSFFSVNSIGADAVLFSIGNTTSGEIKKHCDNTIVVSDFPAKDKLAHEAINYFLLQADV